MGEGSPAMGHMTTTRQLRVKQQQNHHANLTPGTGVNSKQITDPKARSNTMKCMTDNHTLGLGGTTLTQHKEHKPFL